MNSAQLNALRNVASTLTERRGALSELRGAVSSRNVYPFTLCFTRRFTSGSLAGATHDDTIPFCSELDAEEWVSEINALNLAGKTTYRVESWRVVSNSR